MASTLYVVSEGVNGPPGFGVTGGPPGCPPAGFNGCGVWARPVITRPIGSNPEAAGSETATISAIAVAVKVLMIIPIENYTVAPTIAERIS